MNWTGISGKELGQSIGSFKKWIVQNRMPFSDLSEKQVFENYLLTRKTSKLKEDFKMFAMTNKIPLVFRKEPMKFGIHFEKILEDQRLLEQAEITDMQNLFLTKENEELSERVKELTKQLNRLTES